MTASWPDTANHVKTHVSNYESLVDEGIRILGHSEGIRILGHSRNQPERELQWPKAAAMSDEHREVWLEQDE